MDETSTIASTIVQPRDNSRSYSILMINHHRRSKSFFRSHAMARALVNRGHQVTQIVIADRRKWGIAEYDWAGVRTIETPDLLWGRGRSGWDPWNALNRIRVLFKDSMQYDLIHCFETRPATIYPVLFYNNARGLPLIIDWVDWWGRGGIVDELRPWLWRILFGWVETFYEENFRKLANGSTVISTSLAIRAKELGVPEKTIRVVTGGTDTDLFKPLSVNDCRKAVGISDDMKVVGFSSFDSFLDIEEVFRAIKTISKKFPTVRLLLTGNVTKKVIKMVNNHAIDELVINAGLVPYRELPIYLACVDVFVLPLAETVYNRGRWPNKFSEFLSMGRPIVSNPVGDAGSFIEDNKTGILCSFSSQGFSAAIERLFEEEDLAIELGKNARQAAINELDWRILIKRVESLYIDTLGY